MGAAHLAVEGALAAEDTGSWGFQWWREYSSPLALWAYLFESVLLNLFVAIDDLQLLRAGGGVFTFHSDCSGRVFSGAD